MLIAFRDFCQFNNHSPRPGLFPSRLCSCVDLACVLHSSNGIALLKLSWAVKEGGRGGAIRRPPKARLPPLTTWAHSWALCTLPMFLQMSADDAKPTRAVLSQRLVGGTLGSAETKAENTLKVNT